jgi:hypothetical protein
VPHARAVEEARLAASAEMASRAREMGCPRPASDGAERRAWSDAKADQLRRGVGDAMAEQAADAAVGRHRTEGRLRAATDARPRLLDSAGLEAVHKGALAESSCQLRPAPITIRGWSRSPAGRVGRSDRSRLRFGDGITPGQRGVKVRLAARFGPGVGLGPG